MYQHNSIMYCFWIIWVLFCELRMIKKIYLYFLEKYTVLQIVYKIFIKSQMQIFNTNFWTKQYPFSILYLPTQIQIDIVYRKKLL